ncbi:hypothetical protein ACH4OV_25320 [Streptomyces diastaticus]|uniref:hypothetical protein n=1 Tax=Streptomyces diastaticus TaxID=1956 RepID=UPI003795B7EC
MSAQMEATALGRFFSASVPADDYRTSLADMRTALCLARGVDINDIDAAQGWDISSRAFDAVASRWLSTPLTMYRERPYDAARAVWARLRPDLISSWPPRATPTDPEVSHG